MDWVSLLEAVALAILVLAVLCWFTIVYCQTKMRRHYRKGWPRFLFWSGLWQFKILEADMAPDGLPYLRRLRLALQAFFALLALLVLVALVMIFGFGAYSDV